MIIKCTLSVTPEYVGYYAGQSCEVPPLPEYVAKMGPYVDEQEEGNKQVIITYQFDKSKFIEAWGCISEQLDNFRIIPGFTLSVHILENGREVKGYRISLNHARVNRRGVRSPLQSPML